MKNKQDGNHSTKINFNIRLVKACNATERLSMIWKSDQSDL